MRSCPESCQVACPVIRFLRDEYPNQLNLTQGKVAAEIAATASSPEEAIQELQQVCEPGAPGVQMVGLGTLICKSAVIRSYELVPDVEPNGSDEARRTRSLGFASRIFRGL